MIIPWKSRLKIPVGTYGGVGLRRRVNFNREQIENHIWCAGKTKSGKSRWLANFMLSVYEAGHSFTLLDPHGGLAKFTLHKLIERGHFDKREGFENIIYLDIDGAFRRDRFFPMNVLNQSDYPERRLGTQILDIFKRAWPELQKGSANLDLLVLASVAVLKQNGLPLPAMHHLLTNKEWRDRLLEKVNDPDIVDVFLDRLDQWRNKSELVESTLRRTFRLSYSDEIKYSLVQRENLLDYQRILGQNKTVIINLGKLHLSDVGFLGCLFTVQLETGAFAGDEAEDGDPIHFFVMDEAPNFLDKSGVAVSKMLSEIRKFGVQLVMAHQDFGQVGDIWSSLQNADVSVAFRLGVDDSARAVTTYGKFDPLKVKNLVKDERAVDRTHPAYVSLSEQDRLTAMLISKLPQQQFLMRKPDGNVVYLRSLDLPKPRVDPEKIRAVEKYYLDEYFHPKSEIEREIARMRPPNKPEPELNRVRDLRAGSS